MGWEKRKSGIYFYRAVRLPSGRRVKEYCGRGHEAHVAATSLGVRKAARSNQSDIMKDVRSRTLEAEKLLQEFHMCVSQFLAAEMLANGFHNPASRGWRKIMRTEVEKDSVDCAEKSQTGSGEHPSDGSPHSENNSVLRPESASDTEFGSKAILNKAAVRKIRTPGKVRKTKRAEVNEKGSAGAVPAAPETEQNANSFGPPATGEKSVKEMTEQELYKAARFGSRAAISRLRPIWDRDSSRYAALGCLTTKAKIKWFETIHGEDLIERDLLRRSQQDLATRLLKDGDSPLERLIVDDIVLCFLRSRYWMGREMKSLVSDINLKEAEFTLEQSAKAQKQFLKAMDALRDYRSLVGRRALSTPPRVLEEPAADNTAGST